MLIMSKINKKRLKKQIPSGVSEPPSNLEESNKNNQLQLSALWKSITGNYLFFIALFFCLYKFKQSTKYTSSYFILVLSFIFASFQGYFSHYVSHHMNFTNLYQKCDNILTRNKFINCCLKAGVDFLDFHDKIHHDTGINKQILNICYEFLNNVYMQGLGVVLIIKFIDIRVLLLWAFMYASVHNINYLYLKPTTHKDHHLDHHTNYGLDFVDIILNTKYDYNDIELHNHAGINLILIAYVICYFTD